VKAPNAFTNQVKTPTLSALTNRVRAKEETAFTNQVEAIATHATTTDASTNQVLEAPTQEIKAKTALATDSIEATTDGAIVVCSRVCKPIDLIYLEPLSNDLLHLLPCRSYTLTCSPSSSVVATNQSRAPRDDPEEEEEGGTNKEAVAYHSTCIYNGSAIHGHHASTAATLSIMPAREHKPSTAAAAKAPTVATTATTDALQLTTLQQQLSLMQQLIQVMRDELSTIVANQTTTQVEAQAPTPQASTTRVEAQAPTPQEKKKTAADKFNFADSHQPAPVHSLRANYVGKLGQNTSTQPMDLIQAQAPTPPSDTANHGHHGPTTATLSMMPARENNGNPSVVAKFKPKISPNILDDVVQHNHMNQGQTLQGTIVP
jgi:hypothetical protein